MMNSLQEHDRSSPARKRFWRVAAFAAAAVVVAVFSVAVIFAVVVSPRISSKLNGFQPPEMAAAQYTAKDVIGDLGGMKVRIPKYYAEYVEYDGDPGFGEKRKGPRPERTFDSRLRSFGVDARFPDMKGQENWKIRDQRSRQSLKEDMWLRMTIISGEHYPGDGFLDAHIRRTLFPTDPNHKWYWWDTYERMPEDEYELEVWRLSGMDPHTGKPARDSIGVGIKDIYVHRDPSGHVDAHMDCSKPSVPKGIGICELNMNLAPEAGVWIRVSFRRGLLPQWQQIKQSSRKLLLSFEVDPSAAATAASAPASAQSPQQ